MMRPIERDLSTFIRTWKILGPTIVLVSLGMVLFAWPDRWFAWLMFLLAVLFGYLMLRHTRMARRALNLVRQGQPEDCVVELRKESGDERDYVKGTVSRQPKEKWEISFSPPVWNVDPILRKALQARVYFEDETGTPLVVLLDEGYLWAESVPTKVDALAPGD